jgi:hypothetical protein
VIGSVADLLVKFLYWSRVALQLLAARVDSLKRQNYFFNQLLLEGVSEDYVFAKFHQVSADSEN